MAKYLVIIVRKWLSDTSAVYDYVYEEINCNPKELKDKLIETLISVPRVANNGHGGAAVQPQLLQVIPLSVPCGSCNHAEVAA